MRSALADTTRKARRCRSRGGPNGSTSNARITEVCVRRLAGFRAWVVEECPVASGRRAGHPAPAVVPAVPSGGTVPQRAASVPGRVRGSRKRRSAGTGKPAAARPRETKTARFLALVTSEHGPLAAVPLGSVARISAALAPQTDLNAGSARTALRRAVLAAQNGQHSWSLT